MPLRKKKFKKQVERANRNASAECRAQYGMRSKVFDKPCPPLVLIHSTRVPLKGQQGVYFNPPVWRIQLVESCFGFEQ